MTVLLGTCLVMSALAQITLKGKVVDADTGKPIEGANVRLEQTTIGCATNDKGEFIIKNAPDGNYILRATCLDYSAASQKVNHSQNNIVLKLKSSYINLDQVVVTGTGTHHKLKDSPVPIEVISGNELRKSGTTDFITAMTMLNPSLSFSPTAGMGSYLTMNGLSNKYVVIMVDGQRLSGDVAGNIEISRINMNNIKRIEVLKGAASSLYGSDAIAGVINIITENPKNFLTVSSSTKVEEHAQLTQTVNADVTTKKFGSYTSYMYQQANGWQLSDIDEDGEPTNQVPSAGFGTHVVNQKFTFAPTKKLSFYAGGQFYDKLTDRSPEAYSYNIGSQDYTLNAGGKYLLGKSSYISLDLLNDNFTTTYKYITEDKKSGYNVGDRKTNKKQHFYDANLKGVFRHNNFAKTSVGFEYLEDKLKNPDAQVIGKSVYTLGLYAQEELKWKGLQAILGLRYVYHETFKSRVTPKASLMYSVGDFNFRASYSAGFRTPKLEDLYYDKVKTTTLTIGNPDLGPEKSNYYSLNAEYANKFFTVAVTGYINEVNDMISDNTRKITDAEKEEASKTHGKDAEKLTKYKTYVNLDKAQIKGIDINLSSYLGYGFTLSGGYSYAYARGKSGDGEWSILNRSIRNTGSVTANWIHSWKENSVNINLNGRFQSRRYHFSSDSKGNRIDESAPGYGMWNLNCLYTFTGLRNFTLEPGAGINNIFDRVDRRPYGSNYATLSPGRTVYVSLALRFKQ